jgi:hypothetical protein
MAPQVSKKCGLLPPDHHRIGSCTSTCIDSEKELPRMAPQVHTKSCFLPLSEIQIAFSTGKSLKQAKLLLTPFRIPIGLQRVSEGEP